MVNTLRRSLSLVLLAAVIVGGGLVLLTAQPNFGVHAALVNGRSMLPDIRTGDLVVVVQQDDYAVGDVVLYRAGTNGAVLHRIQRLEQGRFVLKGDNNPSEDSARPTLQDIRGRLALRVPQAGYYLDQLRSPLVETLLLSVFFLGLLPARRKRARGRSETNVAQFSLSIEHLPGQLIRLRAARAMLAVTAIAALGAIGLTWYRSSGLPFETVPVSAEIRHLGSFTYNATTSSEDPLLTKVSTGQPLYLRITDQFTVDYRYRYESDRAMSLGGTTTAVARVRSDDGWTADIAAAPERSVGSEGSDLQLTVDLRSATAAIKRLEAGTGARFPQYYLDIVPTTEVNGRMGDAPVDFVFGPQLTFRLDQNGLRLERTALKEGSVLEPRDAQTVTQEVERPRRFALLGMAFAVPTDVEASWALWAVSGGSLVATLVVALRFARKPSAARLAEAMPDIFVATTSAPEEAQRAVRVARLGELIHLADGVPVLLTQDEAELGAFVRRDGTWYSWSAASALPAVRDLAVQHRLGGA